MPDFKPADNPIVFRASGYKIDLLLLALKYAGHRSECDWLQPMWHKGPCDCGWGQLEKELVAAELLSICEGCNTAILMPEHHLVCSK